MITTIAVDPGKSGGVAFHNPEDGIYQAYDLEPITDVLESMDVYLGADMPLQLVVEDVPPYTGKNIPSSRAFKLGKSYGLILGIGLGKKLPIYVIKPKDWQSTYGLGKLTGYSRKKALKDICTRMYPKLNKVTNNTCDAVLILHTFINAPEKYKK